MDQGPSQSILERSAGEAALEAARAIAAALAAPSRAVSTPSASLAGGNAGEALFFAYLAQAFPGEGHEEVALERLERAIAALAQDAFAPNRYRPVAEFQADGAHDALQRRLVDPDRLLDEPARQR